MSCRLECPPLLAAIEAAVTDDRPADHVAVIQLLVLANASRRNFGRAAALAREGFALRAA